MWEVGSNIGSKKKRGALFLCGGICLFWSFVISGLMDVEGGIADPAAWIDFVYLVALSFFPAAFGLFMIYLAVKCGSSRSGES